MGNYVLYLLMQAFVTMIFAYFAGTRAIQRKGLPVVLPTLGLYLLMGSSLLEVWGDRAGWTAWAIGANAAMVSVAVSSLGSGALLASAPLMERPDLARRLALLVLLVSVAAGAVLASVGAGSEALVDPSGIPGAEISGGFSHLGTVGWALGSPLLAGAALVSWMGARAFVARGRPSGLWLVGTGGLFLVWPLDPWVAGLPLAPAALIFAVCMAHFGLDSVEDDEGEVGREPSGPPGEGPSIDGREDDGPPREGSEEGGMAPWVREAISATGEGPAMHPGEDVRKVTPDDETGDGATTGSDNAAEAPGER